MSPQAPRSRPPLSSPAPPGLLRQPLPSGAHLGPPQPRRRGPGRTSRSLRPRRRTSSMRVSRVSLESPFSSSPDSSRRPSSSGPPPAPRSLSAAALREASVRRCTRPELRWVSEVMAGGGGRAEAHRGEGGSATARK